MARSKTRVDFEFVANLRSLRGALIATLPHVGGDKDLPALQRLRVFVSAAGVFVAATDRYTMGLARVTLNDPRPVVLGCFDLDAGSAKLILHVFRPAGKDDDPVVKVEVTEKKLTVTDVSGLFPGTSLSLVPSPAHPDWPDLPAILGGMWRRRGSASALTVGGEFMGRFSVAARAFGDTLLIEPLIDGQAVAVSCGDSFVGVLMCRTADDYAAERAISARGQWLGDLGPLADVMPEVPEPLPKDAEAEEAVTPIDLGTVLDSLAEDGVTVEFEPGDES